VSPLLELDPERIDESKPLLRAALEHVGVDPARTSWDRARVRVVEPLGPGEDARSIGFHRDTWGSNLLAQTNWWTPVRPLESERTIAFYPRYWSRPIENSSATWDLDEVRERRRRGEPVEDIQIVPEPTEPVDTDSELRVVMEPGDLLCFSGAHLHASVPNVSAETRCSVELRTVFLDDLVAGRGAPDLDGRAPRVPLGWFRSMVDGSPLREEQLA
jgi:Phytanoyl-CoA dioxygenase (PhyH)